MRIIGRKGRNNIKGSEEKERRIERKSRKIRKKGGRLGKNGGNKEEKREN